PAAGGSGPPQNLSCDSDRSADALMAKVPADGVVVVVPGKTALSYPCEYFWPLVAEPRASVNPFTMQNIPARLSGPRAALLNQRRARLMAAADGAHQDRVAGSDLIAIAQTLPPDRPVFVLLAKSVNIDADPRIVRVAEQGPLALLKVGAD